MWSTLDRTYLSSTSFTIFVLVAASLLLAGAILLSASADFLSCAQS